MVYRLTDAEYNRMFAELRAKNPGLEPVEITRPADPGPAKKASGRISRDAYKSGLERKWAALGPAILEDRLQTKVIKTLYEPISINLPGGSYTPDFGHLLADGRFYLVETKGNRRMKNARDARSKFRAAAEILDFFYFVYVYPNGKSGFEIEFYS